MYSPKIAEDLIPLLYEIRKRKKVPMTKIVDEILRKALQTPRRNAPSREGDEEQSNNGGTHGLDDGRGEDHSR